MTRGNQVPFCLPSTLLPPSSPLFSRFPSPSELLLCGDFLDTEGHSCVIVMQQSSAAWDGVNETAFSNEKLLWHVLKDKGPTVGRVCAKFFNLAFTMLLWNIVSDQFFCLLSN